MRISFIVYVSPSYISTKAMKMKNKTQKYNEIVHIIIRTISIDYSAKQLILA